MRCDACATDNEEGARFCRECGNALSARCASCGNESSRAEAFCSQCGAPVASPEETSTGDSSAEAERRQLTVMFCDLVGSVSLSERLDSEELRDLIRAYHDTCGAVIRRFDGHVAQYLGDGLLVYFGYPVAREDDAVRAVRAGLDIIAALERLNRRMRHRLDVRIGINTGQVVVGEIGGAGRREELALGSAPNIAARIQARAEPNAVIIGADTHTIVKGFFECVDLGPVALVGLSTTVRLFEVTGLGQAINRYDIAARAGLTPIVGRGGEVFVLESFWRGCRAGHGHVTLIRGEAGIGKTRLVEVVKQRAKRDGATLSEFRCSPEHRTASLYPVVTFLERSMRFHECRSAEEKFARLEARLASYRFGKPEVVAQMAALLSLPVGAGYPSLTMSPSLQRQRTLESLVIWLREETESRPMLSVWEDLHWADPSTLELLGLLIEGLAQVPTLAVLTFRPAFTPMWPERAHMNRIDVARLSDAAVESMVRGLAGDRELPSAAVEHVVARTDGVPLFVEELTKMLLETGALQQTSTGYAIARELADTSVPSTLQDSLMARLDRLGKAKPVAQLGAVLGREFSYSLIRAVGGYEDAPLQGALGELCGAELLREYGVRPEARYVFKHSLIRDTAYNSLLRSRKRQLHRKVAEELEKSEGVAQSQPELLAHHFAAAEAPERAIDYWQRAGEKAVRRSANTEAVHHLQAGLKLLEELEPSPARDAKELALQVALGAPLMAVQGFASTEVQAIFTRARQLCHSLRATADLFPVLFRLRSFHLVKGDVQTAHDIGEELVDLARRAGDPDLLVEAHYALGAAIFYCGEFRRALEEFRTMQTYYDAERHRAHAYLFGQEPGMACHAYQAWALACLGHPAEGAGQMQAALDIAESADHPFSLAFSWTFAAMFHNACGQAEPTLRCAETAMELSAEYGFPFWLALAANLKGWALVHQGEPAAGLESLLRGISGVRRTGSELAMMHHLRMLAEGYRAVGRDTDALRAVEEGIALSERRDDRDFDSSNLYRVKGELLLADRRTGADAAAEGFFARALDVAKRQHARPMALDAATGLARLWHARGETAAALALLSEHLDDLAATEGASALPVVQAAVVCRAQL